MGRSVGMSGTFLSPQRPVDSFRSSRCCYRTSPSPCAGTGGVFVILLFFPQVYLIPKFSMWDGGPDLFARFWLRLRLSSCRWPRPQLHRRSHADERGTVRRHVAPGCARHAQLLTVMTDERRVRTRRHQIARLNPEKASSATSRFQTRSSAGRSSHRFNWQTSTHPGLSVPRYHLTAAIAGGGCRIFVARSASRRSGRSAASDRRSVEAFPPPLASDPRELRRARRKPSTRRRRATSGRQLKALSSVSRTFAPTITCTPMNAPVACVRDFSHTVPLAA